MRISLIKLKDTWWIVARPHQGSPVLQCLGETDEVKAEKHFHDLVEAIKARLPEDKRKLMEANRLIEEAFA